MSREQEQEPTRSEQEPRQSPRVWIASLSDYNDGRLHGVWLDANAEAEDLAVGIQEMLARSAMPGAEEWAIHDYEGFGPLRLGEYETSDRISRMGLALPSTARLSPPRAFGTAEDELLDNFERQLPRSLGVAQRPTPRTPRRHRHRRPDSTRPPESLRPYVMVDTEARTGHGVRRFAALRAAPMARSVHVFLFHPP